MVVHGRRRALASAVIAVGLCCGVGCTTASTGDLVGARSADSPGASLEPSTTHPPSTTQVTTTTTSPSTTSTSTTTTTTLPPTTTLAPNVVSVPVVEPPLQAVGGSSGNETARVQQRLLDLGFWLEGVDGRYGLTTRQAVMAFEKYLGFEADGRVDQVTADWLTAMTTRPIARANAGTLVEVDKAKQLLFFVIDGQTTWILNTSTGNGEEYTEEDQNSPGEMITGVSLTPSGLHRVNRERAEGWWEGDLGEIYRPKYFVGGVAVHGSNSIPNYPASHGCVRVSVPAMDWIWENNLMPMRIPVWVHDGV